ncbi:hypothetical protein ACFSE1_14985 [Rhizobium helianthi]|uniref:Lipoprotein n=1 Tax=Rhizobium helianthi TaxID=1132695 RepID=A0ABW4M5Q9_9HYPH
MRKLILVASALLGLSLAGCDSDKQNSRSDTDKVTTEGIGTAPAQRDPTPDSSTGGGRENRNGGFTQ